jgi:hypothetical protein
MRHELAKAVVDGNSVGEAGIPAVSVDGPRQK